MSKASKLIQELSTLVEQGANANIVAIAKSSMFRPIVTGEWSDTFMVFDYAGNRVEVDLLDSEGGAVDSITVNGMPVSMPGFDAKDVDSWKSLANQID